MAGGLSWGLGTAPSLLEKAVDDVIQAEQLGFDTAYIGESNLGADAYITAAAALRATTTIAVTPGIVGVHDRHPAVVARTMRTLHEVAPGRTGITFGRRDCEQIDQLGLQHSPAIPALRDTINICRELWRGQSLVYSGEHWSAGIDASHLPPIAIRVGLAAVGPVTLRLAGAIADVVVLNYGASHRAIAESVATVRAAAAAAGRDPAAIAIHAYVLVARTDVHDGAAQMATTRRIVKSVLEGPEGQFFAVNGKTDVDDPAVLPLHAAIGDRSECLAWIEAVRTAGVDCPVLIPAGMRSLFA